MRKVKLKFRFLVDDNGMLKGDTDLFRNCLKKYARKYVDVILQDAPNQKEIKEDRKRSLRQNAYYWGVVNPIWKNILEEEYGGFFSQDETHEFLKQEFNYVERVNINTGEIKKITQPTKENSVENQMVFCDKCRHYALEMFNIDIPLPPQKD